MERKLTSYEDILVRGTNELHCLRCEQSHVLVNSIACNIFIGTVVEGDENVQKDDPVG